MHDFLEAKLLEQVNLHFWIIYNTHCWFNMLLCTCTMSWSGKLWIILLGSGGGIYGVGDP